MLFSLELALKNKPNETIDDFVKMLSGAEAVQKLQQERRVALARQILEGLGLKPGDLLGDVIEHEPAKRGRSTIPADMLQHANGIANSTG